MAFNGKLIELKTNNNYVALPLTYMRAESYKATPNQRLESSAARSVEGLLHRTTCSHTATKVEFETPPMTNTEVAALQKYFSDAYTNATQRNIEVKYYDPETDTYKEGLFYMPDVDYPIMRIDGTRVYYNSIRYAFIEY